MIVTHRIQIEPAAKRIEIYHAGIQLAASDHALQLKEASYPAVYYFPADDVQMPLLTPIDKITTCPFKGKARHWALHIDGKTINPAAWSYEDPLDDVRRIKGHIAFYSSAIEELRVC